jgi:hypothetical protein
MYVLCVRFTSDTRQHGIGDDFHPLPFHIEATRVHLREIRRVV